VDTVLPSSQKELPGSEPLAQRAGVTCHQVSGQDGHTLPALHDVIYRALNLAFRRNTVYK